MNKRETVDTSKNPNHMNLENIYKSVYVEAKFNVDVFCG